MRCSTHRGAGVYGVALSLFPLGTRASNLVSLSVVDSVFEGNVGERPADWAGSSGGALAVQGVDASSDRYLLTQVLYSGAAVRIERTHFTSNVANGGGAVWLSPLSALSIANCTFRRNSADIIGGALRLWQGTHPFETAHFSITNSIFEGNIMRECQTTILPRLHGRHGTAPHRTPQGTSDVRCRAVVASLAVSTVSLFTALWWWWWWCVCVCMCAPPQGTVRAARCTWRTCAR